VSEGGQNAALVKVEDCQIVSDDMKDHST
jgi:hypothetical protein